MKRKTLAVLLALCLLLCGCKGRPLPGGMDEAALLQAGQDVVLLLVDWDYEAVYAALRDDVAAGTSAEDIAALAESQLKGMGGYRQITDRMTTGQSSGGEDYGVAVLYCEFDRKDAVFRLAFDPDYALIGLEVKKQ